MPNLNEFTVSITFISLPGIITYFLLSKLIGSSGKSLLEKILLILLFSILSYLFYYLVFYPNKIFYENDLSFLRLYNDVGLKDIFYASLGSIVLAFILAYLYNYKIFNKFAQFIKSTKRYGDEDVWYYFHNSYSPKKGEWFVVRDHKNDLMYYGYISAYSEANEDRELLMFNVSVYSNSTADFLYETNHLYLCLSKNDISIEIFNNKNK